MTRAPGRSPEIRQDTEGGPARCPRVNSYDRWFSDMLIFRAVRIYTFRLSHLPIRDVQRATKRSTCEFTVNEETRLRSKTAKAKATKQEGGHEKHNSRPRVRAFVLLPPSTCFFFFASSHKSEIRIKKARHVINVRQSRRIRSASRRRHSTYTCRFIKNMHSSTRTRVHVERVCASRAVGSDQWMNPRNLRTCVLSTRLQALTLNSLS